MKSSTFFARIKKVLRYESTQRIIGIILITVFFIWGLREIQLAPSPKISAGLMTFFATVLYLLCETIFITVLHFVHAKFFSKTDPLAYSGEVLASVNNALDAPVALV